MASSGSINQRKVGPIYIERYFKMEEKESASNHALSNNLREKRSVSGSIGEDTALLVARIFANILYIVRSVL